MVRGWKKHVWAAAPAITIILILASPLRVLGGDTLPGSLGGLARHCSALTRLDTIDEVARLNASGRELPYWMVHDVDGGVVSTWGPGPQMLSSVAFVNVDAGDVLSPTDLRARARIVAALWLALGIGILTWWLARTLSPVKAMLAGVAVATSYAASPTLGQAVWQATVAIVPLFLGFVLSVRPAGRFRLLAPAALLLATMLRPPIFLFAIGLGVHWLLARPRWTPRQLALASVLALVAACPVAIWDLGHLGTVLPLGQWHASKGESAVLFHLGPAAVIRGIAGLLFSPARGLVWFAPLALVGGVVAWMRGLRVVAVACVAQLLFVASWYDWWGGQCFGPRLMSEVVLVTCAIALAFAGELGTAMRRIVIGAAAWTCLVGLLGTFRWDASQWEARRKETPSGIWNVVDGPLPRMARRPVPITDWLDQFSYRCIDVGVETSRR